MKTKRKPQEQFSKLTAYACFLIILLAIFCVVALAKGNHPYDPEILSCLDATVDETLYPSPDGLYLAINDGLVFDKQMTRCKPVGRSVIPKFVGWTPDSRYALFNFANQYGESWSAVFDVQSWEAFYPRDPDMPLRNASSTSKIIAIAPLSQTILLADGTLVSLPDRLIGNILTDSAYDRLASAAWSSEESHLAFAAYASDDAWDFDGRTETYIYTSDTGAKEIMAMTVINYDFPEIVWVEDNAQISLHISNTSGQFSFGLEDLLALAH